MKIEYGRETALVQQQNEFLQKKIEERMYMQLNLNKNQKELKMGKLLQKLNIKKLRNSLKEAEYYYNKQASTLDREKAI